MYDNCNRKDYSNDDIYSLNLIRVPYDDCNTTYNKKRYCFLYEAEEVVLCKYCNNLFRPDSKVTYNNAWPSFM